MKGKIVAAVLCLALAVGVLSGCVEEQPPANVIPAASFTYTPTTVYVNTTEVSFTDTSTDEDGTIASWSWDFGDTTTSTVQNPTHTYTAIGTYTVTLIVTDDDGNASDPYTTDITVGYNPPTADFTYDPMVNITVNETTITFTDNSTAGDANITSWLWDFGDDTNATDQNSTHMYNATGNFTVMLTVTDANALTDTTTVTITVEAAAEAT